MARRKKVRLTAGQEIGALEEAAFEAERAGRKRSPKTSVRRTAYKFTPGAQVPDRIHDVVEEHTYLGVRFAIVEIKPSTYTIEILYHPFPYEAGYPSIQRHRYIAGSKGKTKTYDDPEKAYRCAKAAIRDVQVWFEDRGIALRRSRKSGRAKQDKGSRARRHSGAIAQTPSAPPMPDRVRQGMKGVASKAERSREVRRLASKGGSSSLKKAMAEAQAKLEAAQVEAQARALPKMMTGQFVEKGTRPKGGRRGAEQASKRLKKLVDADPKVQAALEEVRRIERAQGALAMEKRILEDDGSGRKKNPSPKRHAEVGHAFLKKSESSWERYCKRGSVKALFDAYEDLIIAHKELGYARDKEGLKQAKKGLSAARAELKARMK